MMTIFGPLAASAAEESWSGKSASAMESEPHARREENRFIDRSKHSHPAPVPKVARPEENQGTTAELNVRPTTQPGAHRGLHPFGDGDVFERDDEDVLRIARLGRGADLRFACKHAGQTLRA